MPLPQLVVSTAPASARRRTRALLESRAHLQLRQRHRQKAEIAGWSEVLIPALRGALDVALWPFEGLLAELLAPGRSVVAETYPAATIVFPHLGGNRDDIFTRIAIVARHKNTHIDLSGSGIERVGILERAVREIGADRVLYGSDFTINEPSAVIARVKNAFLTAEDREKILSRNVERLLAKASETRRSS